MCVCHTEIEDRSIASDRIEKNYNCIRIGSLQNSCIVAALLTSASYLLIMVMD